MVARRCVFGGWASSLLVLCSHGARFRVLLVGAPLFAFFFFHEAWLALAACTARLYWEAFSLAFAELFFQSVFPVRTFLLLGSVLALGCLG